MKLFNFDLLSPRIHESNDSQKLILIIFIFGVSFLVFLGDQVCYQRASEGVIERFVAYPTSWGYVIFEDRFASNLFSFCFWLIILGSGGYWTAFQLERHWIEPMTAKCTVDQLAREKKWINRYGNDLF